MQTKLIFSLALSALLPFSALAAKPKAAAPAAAETFNVKPADSKITWEGKKKIGDAHHGELTVKSGKLIVAGGKLTGGDFEVDMTSLKVSDLQDEGMNKKLTGHLRSDDFFSVDKHPTAMLMITKVAPGKDGKTQITGDLSIKGKKESVTFPADVQVTKDQVTAKAVIAIDRTKYDVRYNSGKYFPNLGDKIINDEFLVNVDLTAKK
jgi:polyisoprenoid-binding protein YceI